MFLLARAWEIIASRQLNESGGDGWLYILVFVYLNENNNDVRQLHGQDQPGPC